MLVGTPAVQLPSVLPGIPTNLPEIALMKKSDQRGVAKIAVFAYNRVTGRAVWQSGTAEATSQVKDTWVFGAGPFSRGTIRKRTELAGEPLADHPNALRAQRKAGDALGARHPSSSTPITPPPGRRRSSRPV